MAHNKTLAAQLYAEFKEFFPENAVEYFVSYYDYYQPEAYVPRHDLYIEKETDINEEIERLRLAATTALMSRKDVIIVASVSCIYGIGNPEAYGRVVINLQSGNIYRRNALLRQLIESQYQRNDMELRPGTFRVRGDTLDVIPAYQERFGYRITFFGDEVERIIEFNALTGELRRDMQSAAIYPAKHFITDEDKLNQAIQDIETELEERLERLPAKRQAARSPAPGTAHPVRPGDAARGGLLLGHRELLPPPGPARPGFAALDADGLPAQRLPAGDRRVAHDRPADPRHVQRRPLAQADPGGVRLPPAVRPG